MSEGWAGSPGLYTHSCLAVTRYEYDTDRDMVQLVFYDAAGSPRGAVNWYAVHPTSMNNTNHLISSDNKVVK